MLYVAAIFLIKRHLAMVIVLALYLVLVWLFFSKLKLVIGDGAPGRLLSSSVYSSSSCSRRCSIT